MRSSPGPGRAIGCVLCELAAQPGAAVAAGALVVSYVDDAVVALIEPGRPGVVVAPHSHGTAMTAMPASVLAALREAVLHVEQTYGASNARVERTVDVPGAPGHMCYRVVPYGDEPSIPPAGEDATSSARRLAQMMRGSANRASGGTDRADLGARNPVGPAERARGGHPPLPDR